MRKLSELQVGDSIKFGRYSVNGEEPHDIIWVKVHRDNTFLAKNIEDFRAFDARERSNDMSARREYGNNDYTVSNISQFLNSSDARWYSPQHEHDDEPSADNTYDNTPYNNHTGFLHLFTEEEIEAIEYSEVVTAVPGRKTVIEQRVFLPSLTNIYGDDNNNVDEGDYWDLFCEYGSSRKAYPTQYAVDNTTLDGFTVRTSESWYYWLRSAHCVYPDGVRYVNGVGGCDVSSAYRCVFGLRPALKLNPNILLSDDVDQDGCPILKLPEVEQIEFAPEEFLNLLNI